jgi:EAL domain-containing protein (putative c-di-GMP-specific phosphodiesterase class I)
LEVLPGIPTVGEFVPGYEASGWQGIAHPPHGISSPARFMAVAAEKNLLELAHRALVGALQVSARLDELGIPLQIAINLSVESIMKLPMPICCSSTAAKKTGRGPVCFSM